MRLRGRVQGRKCLNFASSGPLRTLIFMSIIDLLPCNNTSFNTYRTLVISHNFENTRFESAVNRIHFKMRKSDDNLNTIESILLNTVSGNGTLRRLASQIKKLCLFSFFFVDGALLLEFLLSISTFLCYSLI